MKLVCEKIIEVDFQRTSKGSVFDQKSIKTCDVAAVLFGDNTSIFTTGSRKQKVLSAQLLLRNYTSARSVRRWLLIERTKSDLLFALHIATLSPFEDRLYNHIFSGGVDMFPPLLPKPNKNGQASWVLWSCFCFILRMNPCRNWNMDYSTE